MKIDHNNFGSLFENPAFLEKLNNLFQEYSVPDIIFTVLKDLHLIFNASKIGVFVFHKDKIRLMNGRAGQLLLKLGIEANQDPFKAHTISSRDFIRDLRKTTELRQSLHREYVISNKGKIVSLEIIFDSVPVGDCAHTIGFIYEPLVSKQKDRSLPSVSPEETIKMQKLESISSLARGLSHDFNNILSGILGNIALAKSDNSDIKGHLRFLENIEESARQGSRLVSEILTYSQTEKTGTEVFDLNLLINESTGICKSNVSKKVVLHKQLRPDLPFVNADLQEIQQLIIANCIRASKEIGDTNEILTIATGVQDVDQEFCDNFDGRLIPEIGTYVFFELHQTLSQIPPYNLEDLFEPTPEAVANGLDLSSSIRIMRKNRGFIKIKSDTPSGRSIAYYLPTTTHLELPRKKQLLYLLDSVETILLVDDEEIVQITIKRILKKLGYSVFTADNGKEAIELYAQLKGQIDLILLDLAMPVMGGDDALTEILNINPEAKIILFSGYDEAEVKRRLKAGTVVGFIEKPLLIDELGRRVQELFPRKD